MPQFGEPPAGASRSELPNGNNYATNVAEVRRLLGYASPQTIESAVRPVRSGESRNSTNITHLDGFMEYTGSNVEMTNVENLLGQFNINPGIYDPEARSSVSKTEGATEMYLKRYGSAEALTHFIKVHIVKGDKWRMVLMYGTVDRDGTITASVLTGKRYHDESFIPGAVIPYDVSVRSDGAIKVSGDIGDPLTQRWGNDLFSFDYPDVPANQVRQEMGKLVRDGVIPGEPRTVHSGSLLKDFEAGNRVA